MRLKSELYKKEQDELTNKVIQILNLDEKGTTTLHGLDTNKDKQNELLKLIPDIRKYFTYACIKGVREPEKVKRPYLSIIRHLIKRHYKMVSSDFRIYTDDKIIRTIKYTFVKK